jgi:hypothetical protein
MKNIGFAKSARSIKGEQEFVQPIERLYESLHFQRCLPAGFAKFQTLPIYSISAKCYNPQFSNPFL